MLVSPHNSDCSNRLPVNAWLGWKVDRPAVTLFVGALDNGLKSFALGVLSRLARSSDDFGL
jgi:hypothetical protein